MSAHVHAVHNIYTCTDAAHPGLLLLLCHSPHLMSQLVQELLVCVGQEATALLLRGERKRWGLREGEGEREKGGREGVSEKGRRELEVRGIDLLGGWRVGVQLQQSSPVGDVGMQFLNRGRKGG